MDATVDISNIVHNQNIAVTSMEYHRKALWYSQKNEGINYVKRIHRKDSQKEYR